MTVSVAQRLMMLTAFIVLLLCVACLVVGLIGTTELLVLDGWISYVLFGTSGFLFILALRSALLIASLGMRVHNLTARSERAPQAKLLLTRARHQQYSLVYEPLPCGRTHVRGRAVPSTSS